MGCVYLARCKVNGKGYVGKTIGSLEGRKIGHWRDVLNGSNLAFHNALRRYGIDGFEWTVLCEDDDDDCLYLIERRQIKLLKTKKPNGYNLTDGGDGLRNPSVAIRRRIGFYKLGDKTPDSVKKKMSESARSSVHYEANVKRLALYRESFVMSDEKRSKISQTLLGHEVSEETRSKIRDALSGRPGIKGRKASPETRAKISAAQIGRVNSQESNEKRSATQRGKGKSPETCERMKTGRNRYIQSRTPEEIESFRESCRRREARRRELRTKNEHSEAI